MATLLPPRALPARPGGASEPSRFRALVHRLRRWRNPDGETRLFLAKLVRRRGYSIGAYSYGRPKVRFAESGQPLSIGRYCSIADRVEILLGGGHRLDWASTYPFAGKPHLFPGTSAPGDCQVSRGGVSIGHDVWLGSGCIVLSGVTIGHGAVIGARAVVTRDVPPYAVAVGNPARVIRHRFDAATVAALLDAAWWDLPPATVSELAPLINSARIADLVAAAGAARAALAVAAARPLA